ncbi:MAG: HD domain-containing protein [Armatimonadetes bacterium]|nr:HD domain-containing protein [Armatimonadota bacterium]
MTLEDAVVLAVRAHQGQKDKAGESYILHPLRVMLKQDTEIGMMAAVLHDVVEDTSWTFDGLRDQGCSEDVLALIDQLTRRDGEEYSDYLARIRTDPTARSVKLADLEDNLNVLRLRQITPKDADRLNKYLDAWRDLQGDPA